MDCGFMDVAAKNRVHSKSFGIMHDRLFEFADEVDRVLDSFLGVSAERPVTETEPSPEKIDRGIERKQKFVANVAEKRQPLCVLHNRVEFVSVNDQDAAPVRGVVNRTFLDQNVSVQT